MWVLGLSRACAWPSNSSSAASYLREEHGRVSGVMWLSGCKLSGRDRGGASSTRHEHWWRNGESVSCLGRVSRTRLRSRLEVAHLSSIVHDSTGYRSSFAKRRASNASLAPPAPAYTGCVGSVRNRLVSVSGGAACRLPLAAFLRDGSYLARRREEGAGDRGRAMKRYRRHGRHGELLNTWMRVEHLLGAYQPGGRTSTTLPSSALIWPRPSPGRSAKATL